MAQKMSTNTVSVYRRRRSWLLAFAGMAGTGYGFYRLCTSPSVATKKYQLFALLNSLVTISEAASASAQTVSLLSNDVKTFLKSDSDEIPPSLKQLFKLAQCREVNETLTTVSNAMATGVFRGISGEEGNSPGPGVAERVMDKFFTAAGTGFVSVVVGNFARNLVVSFFEHDQNLKTLNLNSSPRTSGQSRFVDVLCRGEIRVLIAECIKSFVSTAVSVYLDRTMHINVYDEICAALTNPKHEAQMKGILITVFNGAVETFVSTSYDVLTNGSSKGNKNSCHSDGETETRHVSDNYKKDCELSDTLGIEVGGVDLEQTTLEIRDVNSGVSEAKHSWIDKISYTLSIPSNRKLLVEVSGKVTVEASRSFFEFLLYKFSEFFTITLPIACHDALHRLLEIVRYVGAKSIVVATVCLAICFHAFTGVSIMEVV